MVRVRAGLLSVLGGLLALQPLPAAAFLDQPITSINIAGLIGTDTTPEPVVTRFPTAVYPLDDDDRRFGYDCGCLVRDECEAPRLDTDVCGSQEDRDAACVAIARGTDQASWGEITATALWRDQFFCEGVPSVSRSGTGVYEITFMHLMLAMVGVCLVLASGAVQLFFDWIARAVPGLRRAEQSDLDKAIEREGERREKKRIEGIAKDYWDGQESGRTYGPDVEVWGGAHDLRQGPAMVPHGADGQAESAGDVDQEMMRREREGA